MSASKISTSELIDGAVGKLEVRLDVPDMASMAGPVAVVCHRAADNRRTSLTFGDLKRHVITDRQVAALGNELLGQRFVERNEFQTSELWGIGSTAPYGHRGDFTTLDGVIRAHGGEARASRDAYIDLSDTDRSALIAWLKTLVIPQ